MDKEPNLKMIPLEDIDQLTNCRDEGDLTELTQSIERHGLLTPILVRPGVVKPFELIAGHRRFKACQTLGYKRIAAYDLLTPDTDDVTALQITENLHRKEMTSLEEAQAFKRVLENDDLTVEQLAEELGKPPVYVQNRLTLNLLIPDLTKILAEKKISTAIAFMFARLSPDMQKKGYRAMKKSMFNVSLDRVANWIKGETERSLQNAPFQGNIVYEIKGKQIAPCNGCIYNTSIDKLFWNGAEKMTCVNAECYDQKIQALLKEIKKNLKKEGIVYKEISSNYHSDGSVPTLNSYTKLGEKEDICDKAIKGLVVQGDIKTVGRLWNICLAESGCKKHYPSRTARPKGTNPELERQKQVRAFNEWRIGVLQKVTFAPAPDLEKFHASNVEMITRKMINKLSFDEERKLLKVYGIDVKVAEARQAFDKLVKSLTIHGMKGLQIAIANIDETMYTTHHGDLPTGKEDNLLKVAADFGIDEKKIAEIKTELLNKNTKPPKEEKKKGKKKNG